MDRILLAIELSAGVRDAIATWQERELVDAALVPVPPASLRLCLLFFGSRSEAEIEALRAAIAAISAPSLEIRLGSCRPLPGRGRPALYVAAADCPDGPAVKREITAGLARAGLQRPERCLLRPYLPLAYVRQTGGGAQPAPQAVVRPPGPLPAVARRPFVAVRAGLYRSETGPQGAERSLLAQVELSSGQR